MRSSEAVYLYFSSPPSRLRVGLNGPNYFEVRRGHMTFLTNEMLGVTGGSSGQKLQKPGQASPGPLPPAMARGGPGTEKGPSTLSP